MTGPALTNMNITKSSYCHAAGVMCHHVVNVIVGRLTDADVNIRLINSQCDHDVDCSWRMPHIFTENRAIRL